MATIICPLCAMSNSTKNQSCTGCNEPLPQTDSPAETASESIPSHELPDASSVVISRGNRLYHAYRDMEDLYILHLGDASSSVTAGELRTWNADNWKRRFLFLVLTRSLIPGGGIMGLLIFAVVKFGEAFKKDDIDLAYVFGPMIMIVLGMVYVIIRHQRLTWAYVSRLIEHDLMSPSDRREIAERSPNFLFTESTLQHVQFHFDEGDPQKSPKWYLIVHDTQKKDTRFEIFTKTDRVRLREALGDFVEGDPTQNNAPKAKLKTAVAEKPERRPTATRGNNVPTPTADVSYDTAGLDPKIWFFGTIEETAKGDQPPVAKAYRFYPSDARILVVPAPGRTRMANTQAANVWGVIGCVAVILTCGLTYEYLSDYSEKHNSVQYHLISLISGVVIFIAIVAWTRRVIMIRRHENDLDEMIPEDLLDLAVNTYNPIIATEIVEGVLDCRSDKMILELKNFKGKKHRIQLHSDVDVKIVRKVCRSLFPYSVKIRKA